MVTYTPVHQRFSDTFLEDPGYLGVECSKKEAEYAASQLLNNIDSISNINATDHWHKTDQLVQGTLFYPIDNDIPSDMYYAKYVDNVDSSIFDLLTTPNEFKAKGIFTHTVLEYTPEDTLRIDKTDTQQVTTIPRRSIQFAIPSNILLLDCLNKQEILVVQNL